MGKTAGLLCRRPKAGLARLRRGILHPLVRPGIARWVGARRSSPLRTCCRVGRLRRLPSWRLSRYCLLRLHVTLVIFNVDGLDIKTSSGGVCRHHGPGSLPPPLLRLRDFGRGLGGRNFPAVCRVRCGVATLDGSNG
jgi:hypothetical protein